MGLGRTSLPPISYGTGAAFLGNASLPGIEDILLFVDKAAVTGAEDGTRQNPFHVIADALTAAAALVPSASRRVTLLIYPGEYSENGLNSVDYVHWVGVGGRDAVRIEANSDTVLTVDDQNTSYEGITFASTDGNPILRIAHGGTEVVEFRECGVEQLNVGASSGYVYINNNSQIRFKDCNASQANQAYRIFLCEAGGDDLFLEGTDIVGAIDMFNGNLFMRNSKLYCTTIDAVRLRSGANDVIIESSDLQSTGRDCIQIEGSLTTGIFRNNKLQANTTFFDINATVAITGLVIDGNVMSQGMNANVSHTKSERNVGASGDLDFYATLDEALDSITFDGIVVRMLKDETVAATVTYSAVYDFVLDGMGHTLDFGVGLVADWTIQPSATVRVKNLTYLGYWFVRPQAAPARITFDGVTGAGTLDITSGSTGTVHVVRSEIFGAAAIAVTAMSVRVASPTIIVEDSYLKGGTAAGFAFYWITNNNNNVHIRRSKVFHGGLGANNPFGRTGVQTPDWYGYQNEMNYDPDSDGWSQNLVAAGQQQTSFDVETDFF